MADNTLRVGAEFDVGPLIAGAKAAGASFDEIKAKLAQVAATAEAAGNTVQAQAARFLASGLTVEETAGALHNLGISATEAGEATEAAAVSVGLLTAAEEQNALAANTVAASTRGMVSAMGAARVEAGALLGSTGMMAFGLARVAASSSTLAPLIEAAFPIFAGIALLDILAQIPTAIDKIIGALSGWDDAAKKAYEEMVEGNYKVLNASIEAAASIRDQNTVGKEGTEKFTLALADNAAHLHDVAAASASLQQQLAADQAEYDRLNTISNKLQDAQLGFTTGLRSRLAELHTEIQNVTKEIGTLTEEQRKLGTIEPAKIGAESGAEALRLSREQQTAQIESAQAVGRAQETAAEQSARAMRTLGTATADQEAELLRDSENRKFAIEQEAIEKRIVLAKTEGSAKAAEVTRMQGELEALEISHNAKLQAIKDSAAEADKRRAQELNLANLDAQQREIEAADKGGEAFARMNFEKAQTAPAVSTAAVDLEQRLVRVYEDQITALKLKAEAMKEADPIANERQIIELGAEEVAIDAQKETAIRALRQETTDKIKEINKKELEDQISEYSEQVSVSRSRYESDVTVAKQALDSKAISMRQYVEQVDTLAGEELTRSIAVYQQETEAVRDAAQRKVITEQEASRQLQAIWAKEVETYNEYQKRLSQVAAEESRKREETLKREADTVARDFTQSVNQILTGHEKIGQSAVKLAASIELSLIDNGIKKVVVKYTEDLLQMLASHSSFLAQLLGLQTTQNAAQLAQAKALQVQIVTDEAGQAYAATFASVMASLPFPVNIATAPALAAEAAAQALSGGLSFEYGGVVPGPIGSAMPIIAHGQEGVLNQKVTSMVNNANTSSSSHTNAPTTVNMENHFHKSGDLSESAIGRLMSRGVRRGLIPVRR